MDDLRLGVAGLGLRRSIALEAHRPGAGARVTAVCDTDPARHEWAREKFGADVTITPDFAELLASGVDAVLILTPDDTHRALGEMALAAGVPTFMEKPLAVTVEDTDALLSLAREHATKLYVGHNMRHMPVIRAMREIIQNGEIGEVQAVWCRHFVGHGGDYYYKDWHADRRRTTSLLLQKGAHDIDVIHWLAGGATREVTAMGDLKIYGKITDRQEVEGTKRDDWFSPATNWPPSAQKGLHPVVDVEDISMMLMRLDNGVHASYQQCHFTPDYWRNYTVIGSEGRLENFGDTGGDAVVRVWNSGRRNYDGTGDKNVEIPPATGGHGGADTLLIGEFLRFVRDGGVTDTSPVAARDSVAAGVYATDSLRNGSAPRAVPEVEASLAAYFARGQVEA